MTVPDTPANVTPSGFKEWADAVTDDVNDAYRPDGTDVAVTDGGTGASSAPAARTNLGLGNVDNTADLAKPISTATQTALDTKAPLASPALTGTPTVPTAPAGTNTTQAASTAFVKGAVDNATSGAAAPRAVILGSSISASDAMTAGSTRSADYWTMWLDMLTHGRIAWVANEAVASHKTADMLADVGDVIAHAPAFCLLEVGPNDAKGDVPSATTLANIAAICDALRGAGIRTIATTPTPTNQHTTTARKTAMFETRLGMLELAQTRDDLTVIDVYPHVADPATTVLATGYTTDGIHPVALGSYAMAVPVADHINAMYPKVSPSLTASNEDAADLAPNPMMVGDTAGVATDVTNTGGTVTCTKVARTDGIVGHWQQVAVTTGINTTLQNATTGFAEGERVYIAVEVEADEAGWAPTDFFVSLQARDASAALAESVAVGDTTQTTLPAPPSGVFRSNLMAVPAGTTTLRVYVRLVGAGTIRIGRMCIRKEGT